MNLNQFALWWDDLTDPKIATRASVLADLKADVEELCSLGNYCNYDMTSKVQSISQKLNKVISSAKNPKP